MSDVISYYRGDTWAGALFTTTFVGGSPPADAQTARMQFRKGTRIVNVTVNVTDAVNWVFTCPPQVFDITQAGDWLWDLEVTDVDNRITTTAKGILRVEADVTR